MLSKSRSSSILTVHFKNQLSSSLTPLTYSTPNNSNTQTHNPTHQPHKSHITHSFISNTLKQYAKIGSLVQGKKIHSLVIKSGHINLLSIQNQLLNFYVKCKEFYDVSKMFDEMPARNVVTWNIIICGVVSYCSNGKEIFYMGFSYFRRMMLDIVDPDFITLNGLIRACIEVNNAEIGKQFHCFVEKLGFVSSCFVGSALVDLYAKFGLVEDARRAFDEVLVKDLVLWNVMVSCYSLNGLAEEAFRVYDVMRCQGFKGDGFTFSSLLSSCGSVGFFDMGKEIHGLIVRLSYDSDVLVTSALVDMYSKNGNIRDARKAFDGMATKNVVSWTTMIVGYGQHGDGKEAVRLLRDMVREDFDPDELTLASVFSSCGHLSNCAEVMLVHAYVIKCGFLSFLSISNALINAYSKCGTIADAVQLFSSTAEPDIVTWTSLINAYGFHGLPREGIETFEMMITSGVRPDHIAFLGVLFACSHGGLVNDGLNYFYLMTKNYGILPNAEHYTCVVDLLGRVGFLKEAYIILSSVPFEPRPDTLAAFTWACKVHGNAGLAMWAIEKLLLLEPNKPVNYTLMSNMYATVGRWFDVASIRRMMKNICDHKVPGCSWVEITGEVHTFISCDKTHPLAAEVYAMLELLLKNMEENFRPNEVNIIYDNIEDESAV